MFLFLLLPGIDLAGWEEPPEWEEPPCSGHRFDCDAVLLQGPGRASLCLASLRDQPGALLALLSGCFNVPDCHLCLSYLPLIFPQSIELVIPSGVEP